MCTWFFSVDVFFLFCLFDCVRPVTHQTSFQFVSLLRARAHSLSFSPHLQARRKERRKQRRRALGFILTSFFFIFYLYHPHESALHTKVFKAIISYSVIVLLQGVTIFSSCFSFFFDLFCCPLPPQTHECPRSAELANKQWILKSSAQSAVAQQFSSILLSVLSLLSRQRSLIETHDKFRWEERETESCRGDRGRANRALASSVRCRRSRTQARPGDKANNQIKLQCESTCARQCPFIYFIFLSFS